MLRTVLVTGATGTVGSAVVPRFVQEGVQVRALVRSREAQVPGARAVLGDLGDADGLTRAAEGVDALIHCAAALNDDPAACRHLNVEGTRHVVEAALSSGARLVHVSTVSVYAHRARAGEVGEDHPLRTGPPDDYGHSKAEAERVVQAAVGRGLVAVVLRATVVLSMHPRSYWGPLALERARTSPAPVMRLAQVPHVHVTNLAEALWRAATRAEAAGRAYNVVDGSLAGPPGLSGARSSTS
jgi:nucleoside-diphosphate-sugar epimerase